MENNKASLSKTRRKSGLKLVKLMSIPDNDNNCILDFMVTCKYIEKDVVIT